MDLEYIPLGTFNGMELRGASLQQRFSGPFFYKLGKGIYIEILLSYSLTQEHYYCWLPLTRRLYAGVSLSPTAGRPPGGSMSFNNACAFTNHPLSASRD
jgi:hypothetical protein